MTKPTTNIERVYAFVIDVETLLQLRDSHFRTIRAIQMESEVITRSSLPQFEKEKAQALESNRIGMMQADESFRTCNNMLTQITGKGEIDEQRALLMSIKAVLRRMNEAQSNEADSTFLLDMLHDTDDAAYIDNVRKQAAASAQDLSDTCEYVVNLIPAQYSVHKSSIQTLDLIK
jgi:hypothetical protein